MNECDVDRWLEWVDNALSHGVKSRHSAFHLMTLATMDAGHIPQQRTVVLRKNDMTRRTVMFHTNIKSPKIAEIHNNPNISLLFYDPGPNVQLRFSAVAHVHHGDDLAKARWQATRPFSRKCYATLTPTSSALPEPGDGLPAAIQKREMTAEEDACAEANFAVVVCNYHALDVVMLQSIGHRRLLFTWDKYGQRHNEWLVP